MLIIFRKNVLFVDPSDITQYLVVLAVSMEVLGPGVSMGLGSLIRMGEFAPGSIPESIDERGQGSAQFRECV
jgi:hypothetical protein